MKKFLPIVLIFVMLFTMISVTAFASEDIKSTVKLTGISVNPKDPVNIIITDKTNPENIKYINQVEPDYNGKWAFNFQIDGTLADYNILFRQNNTLSSEISPEFIESSTHGLKVSVSATVAARLITADYNIANNNSIDTTLMLVIAAYDKDGNLADIYVPNVDVSSTVEEIADKIEYEISGDAEYAKVFCWYDMVPLSNPEVVQFAGDYIKNRNSLGNVFTKLNNNEDVTIVYLGGSVTLGANANYQNDYATSWRGLTRKWFKEQYPDADITFVNAGIGGTGSFWGAIRTESDVLTHNPDLVFVMTPINDVYESMTKANTQRQMENIIRQIREHNPQTDIIMGYDTDKARAGLLSGRNGYEGLITELYDMVVWQEEVARKYNISTMDMGRYMADVVRSGKAVWEDVVNAGDNVHPLDAGHALYAEIATELLQEGKNNALNMIVSYAYPKSAVFGTAMNPVVLKATDGYATGDAVLVNGSGNYPKNYELAPGKSMSFEITGSKFGMYATGTLACSIDGKAASNIPVLSGGVYRNNTNLGSGAHRVTLTNNGEATVTVRAVFTWND